MPTMLEQIQRAQRGDSRGRPRSISAAGGGRIVNISSVVSELAPPNAAVCAASKAAVDAVTRSLAKELGPRNIRVNAVNPGMVETKGWRAAGFAESDLRKQVEAQTSPAKRC